MSKLELWTAMPDKWDDETMLNEARAVIDRDAPFHDTLQEILPRTPNDRVLKITIEVLDGTAEELLAAERPQHEHLKDATDGN